jgi:nicotinate-nucleotide adenylyltransferase
LICLFGGTFDPIHLGHLHAAHVVCEALELSEIRMLLSAVPGHRDATGASMVERWEMLRLACAGEGRLVPDDTEVRRAERAGRPSYTVETLEELRAGRSEAMVAWVVGSDAFQEFTTWHRWRDVLDLTNLVVLERPGSGLVPAGELAAVTRERQVTDRFTRSAGQILCLRAPMRDISATAVRESLAGRPPAAAGVADLLPAPVYTYIKRHHLYGVVSDA